MDLHVYESPKAVDTRVVNVRCPACRHRGAFDGFTVGDVMWENYELSEDNELVALGTRTRIGMRCCPNVECRSALFFVNHAGAVTTFPPEIIDFDATNLPNRILSSLEEAIKCHAAGCFRASALMVRRTLEELCNHKEAKGKDLKARIAELSTVAVVPTELLAAADELRILGNDAAHIEAKNYDEIGKEEAEIAIELAKELLKAVYQYTSLLARLKALKKPE